MAPTLLIDMDMVRQHLILIILLLSCSLVRAEEILFHESSLDQAGLTPVQLELDFNRDTAEELRPQALSALLGRLPLSDKVKARILDRVDRALEQSRNLMTQPKEFRWTLQMGIQTGFGFNEKILKKLPENSLLRRALTKNSFFYYVGGGLALSKHWVDGKRVYRIELFNDSERLTRIHTYLVQMAMTASVGFMYLPKDFKNGQEVTFKSESLSYLGQLRTGESIFSWSFQTGLFFPPILSNSSFYAKTGKNKVRRLETLEKIVNGLSSLIPKPKLLCRKLHVG